MRLLLLLVLLLACAGARAQTAVASCELARGRLLLPVQLNGGPTCLMALDLAAQHPVLDPKVAAAFKLEQREKPVQAADPALRPLESPVVSVMVAPAAGLSHVDSAVLLDMSPLSSFLGREIGGLLPAHLPGYEVTLDFVRQEIVWRELAHSSLSAEGGDTVKMTVAENGAPVVQAAINLKHLHPMEMDLFSATALTLPEKVFSSLLMDEALPTLRLQDAGQQLVRLERLNVGDAQVTAPICAVTQTDHAPRLGLPFLSQFRLTLNYELGLCKLEPSPGNMMTEPQLISRGITLQRMEGGYWRVRVVEASPAARAGASSGDLLISVNQIALAGVSAEAVERLLAASPERAAIIGLSRQGRLISIEVQAEPLL